MGGESPNSAAYMYPPDYEVPAAQLGVQRELMGGQQANANAILGMAASMPREVPRPNIWGQGGANEQAQQIPAINAFQSKKLELGINPDVAAVRKQLPSMVKEDLEQGQWQKKMDEWAKHAGLIRNMNLGLGDSTIGRSAFYDAATAEGQALRRAQEQGAAQLLAMNQAPVAGIDTAHVLGAEQAANMAGMQSRNQQRASSIAAAQQNNQSMTDWINQVLNSQSNSINAYNQGQQQYHQGLMNAATQAAASNNAVTGSYVQAGSTAAVVAAVAA